LRILAYFTQATPAEPFPERRFCNTLDEALRVEGRPLDAHALPGSGGVITVALLELGIERHLRICATEKSVRDLFEGVLRKVLGRE
jgi:hypothetical protein